jgi:hypothetical protein
MRRHQAFKKRNHLLEVSLFSLLLFVKSKPAVRYSVFSAVLCAVLTPDKCASLRVLSTAIYLALFYRLFIEQSVCLVCLCLDKRASRRTGS